MANLARMMMPNKEKWEELGFNFFEKSGDTVLYDGLLPDGWSFDVSSDCMGLTFMDQNGMCRGFMHLNNKFGNREAHMYLVSRYGIHCVDCGQNNESKMVYFGTQDDIIYEAGIVSNPDIGQKDIPWDRRIGNMSRMAIEIDELKTRAKKWANINYPGWEKVDTYWDVSPRKAFITSERIKYRKTS